MNNNQGLSPEKVEELINYVRNAPGYFMADEHYISMPKLRTKIYSLLSAPQPEKTEPKGSELVQSLKDYFKNTAKEQIKKDWEEIEKMNFGGPTVQEYFSNFGGRWSKEVSEGEITEKDFEDLIDAHMTPEAIAKDCFALAQKMARNSILPYQNITDSWKGVGKKFNSGNAEITAQFDSQALASHRTPDNSDYVKAKSDLLDRFEKYLQDGPINYRMNLSAQIDICAKLFAQHSTPVTQEGEAPGLTSKHKDLIRLLLEEAREVLEPYYRSARKRSKNKKQYDYWCMRKHCLENILDGRNPVPSEELPSTPAVGQEEKK